MKRFIIFSISFVALFVSFQILSGYFMTIFYTPDVASAWSQSGNLSNSVTITGSSSFSPLLLAFLAAGIAYFSPKIFIKNTNK